MGGGRSCSTPFCISELPAAACAALLFPTWTPLPPLNFMVIHSFTVHFLLALYPLALTLCGDMDPQPRAFPRCFALARGDGCADLVL